MESRILSVYIERPWQPAYESLWRPEAFTDWAAGLAEGALRREDDTWKARGPSGPVTIHFTPHNAFGIMDHVVEAPDAPPVYVPMRILASGSGCDVQITLFRQPDMSDAQFTADQRAVQRDLATLKRLQERAAAT